MIIYLHCPYPIEHEFDYVRNAVVAIRRYASDHKLTKADKTTIRLNIKVDHPEVRDILETNVDTLCWLTKFTHIHIIK
jgi:hypothetical protein